MTLRITGGLLRGRRLRLPRGADLRPTSDRVRSAIFSILGRDAVENAKVLDLYAGTGALGLEALSRGAAKADFVEANARRCQQLRQNLEELSLADRTRVFAGRVEKVLNSLSGDYDLILADPPYAMDDLGSLMGMLNDGTLLNEDSVVVVEHRFDTELADGYGNLVLLTRRRYGDSSVSIYKAGDFDE